MSGFTSKPFLQKEGASRVFHVYALAPFLRITPEYYYELDTIVLNIISCDR